MSLRTAADKGLLQQEQLAVFLRHGSRPIAKPHLAAGVGLRPGKRPRGKGRHDCWLRRRLAATALPDQHGRAAAGLLAAWRPGGPRRQGQAVCGPRRARPVPPGRRVGSGRWPSRAGPVRTAGERVGIREPAARHLPGVGTAARSARHTWPWLHTLRPRRRRTPALLTSAPFPTQPPAVPACPPATSPTPPAPGTLPHSARTALVHCSKRSICPLPDVRVP